MPFDKYGSKNPNKIQIVQKKSIANVTNKDALAEKCEICTKSFSTKSSLNSHKKKIHFNYVFKCNFCTDKTFSQKVNFYKHLVDVHKQDAKEVATLHKNLKPTKLDNNLQNSNSSNQMDLGSNEVESNKNSAKGFDQPIVITEQENTSRIESNVTPPQTPNSIVHPEKNYKCESCKESFVSQTDLAVHIIAVHVKNSLNLN